MNKGLTIFNISLSSILLLLLLSSYLSTDKGEEQKIQREMANIGAMGTMVPQQIRSIGLKDHYEFAGERVPVESFDVRERLERELLVNSYWHSSTTLNIKMARRFFDIIEPILEEEGIPDDFKYLAMAESNLRNVTSPAGAKGIWQFLSNTGRGYGLEINSEVDERYHYEKATRAACQYIREYYEEFGSWTLAAAAYNMGGPRLKRFLKDQRADNYYDLNLFEETNRYVFRILAFKEILENREQYGFFIEEDEMYPVFEDVKYVRVDQAIPNLGDFAAEHGISYRMLKVYNPWLISGSLNNARNRTYEIKVPIQDNLDEGDFAE
ncbi:MAG: lytic transglycosylase domain-containing protein [Saprospirales bacterium]|nr:MAG: lytic transglycosylase domain-containing protein [Saprospirales bacterium]